MRRISSHEPKRKSRRLWPSGASMSMPAPGTSLLAQSNWKRFWRSWPRAPTEILIRWLEMRVNVCIGMEMSPKMNAKPRYAW
eukprot:symbB.v1.2.021776.t1/scaffold1901.1/size96594/3